MTVHLGNNKKPTFAFKVILCLSLALWQFWLGQIRFPVSPHQMASGCIRPIGDPSQRLTGRRMGEAIVSTLFLCFYLGFCQLAVPFLWLQVLFGSSSVPTSVEWLFLQGSSYSLVFLACGSQAWWYYVLPLLVNPNGGSSFLQFLSCRLLLLSPIALSALLTQLSLVFCIKFSPWCWLVWVRFPCLILTEAIWNWKWKDEAGKMTGVRLVNDCFLTR